MKYIFIESFVVYLFVVSFSMYAEELNEIPHQILGKTLSEVSNMKLGNIFDANAEDVDTDNKHWILMYSNGGVLHLEVRVSDGLITNITNTDGRFQTDKGLKVGMSYEKLLRKYSDLYIVPSNANLSYSVIAVAVRNSNYMFTLKAKSTNNEDGFQLLVDSIQVVNIKKKKGYSKKYSCQ